VVKLNLIKAVGKGAEIHLKPVRVKVDIFLVLKRVTLLNLELGIRV
jgi:hypothetical protein